MMVSILDKISMFKDAAKLLNVEIDDCVIFEDSKTGIGYAKEIGTGLVVGIGDDFTTLKEYGADFCVNDYTEFNCDKYF